MADPIEPALSEEQWAEARRQTPAADDDGEPFTEAERNARAARYATYLLEGGMPYDVRAVYGAIAVLNDTLPESDRRKFTHRTVAMLRDAARVAELDGQEYRDLLAHADALASYLPPDPDETPVYPRLVADLQRKLDDRL